MFGGMPKVDRRPDLAFQRFQHRILSNFVESNRRINVHKNVHNPPKTPHFLTPEFAAFVVWREFVLIEYQ